VATIFNVEALLLQPSGWIESGRAVGLGHLVSLFRGGIETFARTMTSRTKPRLIVVCAIYFFSMTPDGSWAYGPLGTLGYDRDPTKLKALIRHIFAEATSKIEVEGVPVLALPLFEVLDGTDTTDYVNRVEPSTAGGEKIARRVIEAIAGELKWDRKTTGPK